MSPPFLHGVAGPVIHANTANLIDLWRTKAMIGKGRPFDASEDIFHVVLDVVLAFAFGDGFPHNATRPKLELRKSLDESAAASLMGSADKKDEAIEFPECRLGNQIKATLDLAKSIEHLQTSVVPGLKWKLTERLPDFSCAINIKDAYIEYQLKIGVKRLEDQSDKRLQVKSVVNHMLRREKNLAEKDGRPPLFLSRAMIEETFGFLIAGHDTTSTRVSWAVEFLADYPESTLRLRSALQASFPTALAQACGPTIEEITGTRIPYLDATIEELLRCVGTTPMQDRQALCDTEVLGHRIPKCIIMTIMMTGPSMLSPAFNINESFRSESSPVAK